MMTRVHTEYSVTCSSVAYAEALPLVLKILMERASWAEYVTQASSIRCIRHGSRSFTFKSLILSANARISRLLNYSSMHMFWVFVFFWLILPFSICIRKQSLQMLFELSAAILCIKCDLFRSTSASSIKIIKTS